MRTGKYDVIRRLQRSGNTLRHYLTASIVRIVWSIHVRFIPPDRAIEAKNVFSCAFEEHLNE